MLPFDTVLTLVLRDRLGVEIARIDFPIEGNGQRALFVDQIFQDQIEDLPPSFIGSLTFETADEDDKVATVTVRGNTNARNEALFATLDVIDLDEHHARALIRRGVAKATEPPPKRKLPTVGRATSKKPSRAERAEVTPK